MKFPSTDGSRENKLDWGRPEVGQPGRVATAIPVRDQGNLHWPSGVGEGEKWSVFREIWEIEAEELE